MLGQSEKQIKSFFSPSANPRRSFLFPMAIHLPPFPPFGFSVWYDRHHRGRRWCWRERRPSGNPDDLTNGDGFGSKTAAVQAVRLELQRRKVRAQRSGPTES